jgi:hypothetical protein
VLFRYFIAFCRCREAVKLLRFLSSPYSLVGMCRTAHFVDRERRFGGWGKNALITSGGAAVSQSSTSGRQHTEPTLAAMDWGWPKQELIKLMFFQCRTKILMAPAKTVKIKDKAITVTDRGGPWGCETSRLQHFLYNRLTDGGEVVSLTHSWAPVAFYPSGRSLLIISVTT